jgi:hypothetical protein
MVARSYWPTAERVAGGFSVENQKWADIRIPALLDTPARGQVRAEIRDRGDAAVPNGDGARRITPAGDRPRSVQDEVEVLGHDDTTRCSTAIRPASRSSSGAAFVIDRCMSGSRSFRL